MFRILCLVVVLSFGTLAYSSLENTTSVSSFKNVTFPTWFQFGTGTSAYQIEGAWNEDGKGVSIWDMYTHVYVEEIKDGSNGDVACDSYHKFQEDVLYAKFIGVNFYRFSISWTRILPNGYSNRINKAGVQYYNDLIDELLSHDISPVITMYHWDLPQTLQDIGGWSNPLMADYFFEYAKILYSYFGDRVKTWITFNEPKYICAFGYGTTHFPPGYVNQSGIADYLCGHTVLRAHAKAYHLYHNEFKTTQNGEVAIILDTPWYEPATNSSEDMAAAFATLEFSLGWFMNPIFSETGGYPQTMIDRIDTLSKLQGFSVSRLPKFSPEDLNSIKGSADFLGLNIYTSALVSAKHPPANIDDISYFNDIGVEAFQLNEWRNSSNPSNKVTPWAARRLLTFVKNYYGDFPIVITENGFGDTGELQDYDRIEYFKEYLTSIYEAITEDNVDVRAYTAWSLIDSFEWIFGYTQKYGLISVNFTEPMLTRTIKNSARFYKKLIKERSIDWDYNGDELE